MLFYYDPCALQQTHIFWNNLEQPQSPQKQYNAYEHMAEASVHVPLPPETNARLVRKRKKLVTPRGTGVIKKTLSSIAKRGRSPTEQMRKAFRQIVAGDFWFGK